MGIETKSLSFLIGQLITTSHRCWNFQDEILDESLSEHDRLMSAIKAQEENAKRSKLMKAIDDMMGQGEYTMGGDKTYSYFEKKK